MNPAGLKMMGARSEEDIIGLDYCQIPNETTTVKNLMKEAFAGQPSFFEFSAVNGCELKYYESNFIPILDQENNSVKSLMGVSQDITERKKSVNDLKDALLLAELGIKVKNEFLSIISHELRTPLNGIVGGIELLKLSVGEGEAISILEESSNRMRVTLEAILSFIAVNKDSVQVNKADVDLVDVMQSLNKRLQYFPLFLKKKKKVEVTWFGWMGSFFTDSEILDIILWNLISNAIKFTNEGSIKINVSLSNGLVVDVFDTGSGVCKNKQRLLFSEFEITEESMQRSNEGLGLGLALCKKYVSILGGDISLVSSVEGEGSHFRLTLV
jgi:signal transduction histidine kinase